MTYSKVAKHQEDLDLEFGRQIDSQLGGEDLYRCIQCGTCSGICPLSVFMDHTPRQIMAMTRAGFRDDVLSSNTPWLCASCYACTVECPKEIKITDVMYAIKREAIRRKVYPKRFPVPVLAKEFYNPYGTPAAATRDVSSPRCSSRPILAS
jgi:quinone-modifying oxidoreductase subunit QmoC